MCKSILVIIVVCWIQIAEISPVTFLSIFIHEVDLTFCFHTLSSDFGVKLCHNLILWFESIRLFPYSRIACERLELFIPECSVEVTGKTVSSLGFSFEENLTIDSTTSNLLWASGFQCFINTILGFFLASSKYSN